MKFTQFIIVLFITSSFLNCNRSKTPQSTPLKALIIDGSNNHFIWPKTSIMMKDYLEQTGIFKVDIHRLDTIWAGENYSDIDDKLFTQYMTKFNLSDKPYVLSETPQKYTTVDYNFKAYDVVISNFGYPLPEWSDTTKSKFENFIKNGGGFVSVHGANNSWGQWNAYNDMIGLGAWGNRDSNSGPYVYYNDNGVLQLDNSPGICGSHGAEYEYHINTRAPEHPIMKGLPKRWLHAKDELYDRMRGPFKNATILATAYSDEIKNTVPWNPTIKGTNRHEPILMTVNYDKGRIFHTTLGHFDYSMECVGFITTFQRGAEWAASGKVTQEIPDDFPNKDHTSMRKWSLKR